MKNRTLDVFALSAFLLLCGAGKAQSSEPYDNVAAPSGSYLSIYPYYYAASRLMDKNGEASTADPEAARYLSSFKYTYYDKTLFPNTLALVALLPTGCMELFGDKDCGAGDLALTGAYWFVDDPASNAWLGGRMQAVAPVGSYDKNSAANMGGNVWQFRPMLFAAKRKGDVQVELTAKYSIYSTNDDTGVRRGNEAAAEGYAGYFIRPDLLLGAHLNTTFGKDRIVDGAEEADTGVRIFQTGASAFKAFGEGFSVVLEALWDFEVKNSTEGYAAVMRLSWKL